MGLERNPLVPTQEHLEYFYQTVLLPKYADELEEVDVGGGETSKIPKLTFKQRILRPDVTFERGGNKYKPQRMFFKQNKGRAFKPLPKRFQQKQVDKRVAKAKKMPKLQFSLAPVKLIKPNYGNPPQSVFK
jgi:hypothetical protein|tara:strand:+ start:302 stop:694 length:393 start_codon:yes stop_codon:yes gene_type:complete